MLSVVRMWTGILPLVAVFGLWASGAASDLAQAPSEARTSAQHRLSQTQGRLHVPGLAGEVTVIRDKWGIPHIYAKSADDLFFAQGFIQAQDRLFQMDLWRRSSQGRLAEVLGPAYVERDRLNRLLVYRGDKASEWASYHPNGKSIIEQFVKGINAWVAIARANPPIEFTMAGYEPGVWEPSDLLSRAEAFSLTGNALAEVFRSRMLVQTGPEQVGRLLPLIPRAPNPVPNGIDPSMTDTRVSDTLRKINAAVRFGAASAAPTGDSDWALAAMGSNHWVVSGAKSVTGHPILADDGHRALDHPSGRYLVHLNAPGWNVIGGVVPWLPGVAIGHNDRIAWGFTNFASDTQDIYVERLNPDNPRQYESQGRWVDIERRTEEIRVKGQASPVVAEVQYTRHGPVIAIDPARRLAWALRWTGGEPGTVAFLGALSIDQARNWTEFRNALKRNKTPGEHFVYADVDGNIGYQAAGVVPARKNWTGLLPVPGWSGEYEWQGWYNVDDLPHEFNPKSGFLATANNNTIPDGETRSIGYEWGDPARINRIRQVLTSRERFTVKDFEQLQHDAVAWNAQQLVPLLSRVKSGEAEAERIRQQLLKWDWNVAKDSSDAAVYVVWERKLLEGLLAGKVPAPISREYLGRAQVVLVPAVTKASAEWFGQDAVASRDQLLIHALEAALAELHKLIPGPPAGWAWGTLHQAVFRHPLATDAERRGLLNIGPFARSGYGFTVLGTGTGNPDQFEQVSGASYRYIVDFADLDRSVATSAPGQSGQPTSPHFNDLAPLWAAGEYFPLSFGRSAVTRNAETTLVLAPRP